MSEMYIKQEFGKYYIVAESCIDEEESYMLHMITENIIGGHLSCRVSYEGSRKCLFYDVTNKISLSTVFESRYIKLEDLRDIFEQIQNIYSVGNKHLLDERYYYMDPQYIYKDMEDDKLYLMYIPGKHNTTKSRYYELADFLLQRIDRNDNSCVQLAYQFYRMSNAETFSISMFQNIINKEMLIHKEPITSESREIKEEYEPTEMDIETEAISWTVPIGISVALILSIGVYLLYIRKTLYSLYMLTGMIVLLLVAIGFWIKTIWEYICEQRENSIVMPETPVTVDQYWADEETVVFQNNTNVGAEYDYSGIGKIQWKENNEEKTYTIKSFPIVIGKLEGEVDCKINDPSISRLHAKVVKRNQGYFIFDLNSTNGSWVSGIKLLAGEEKQIYQDSNIKLGNVELRIVY